MAEKATLARPYANAVFAMAYDAGALSEWAERLELLATIVSEPAMRAVMVDPRVPRAQVVDLVLSVAGDHFDEPAANLVRVLADNQKLELAPVVWRLFEEERARAQRREVVSVRSAYPLDDDFAQAISDAMRARLRCEVELEADVDPSLIGGVVIRAGDRVIDASVKGRLAELAAALQ